MGRSSPPTGPRISLVAATTGRGAELRRLLQSLAAQSQRDFELLVADQSDSPAETAALIDEFSPDLVITHVIDDGTGVSRARNGALPRARGAILGFPDDDCWYREDILARVAGFFDRHPDQAFLSGIYAEPGRPNPAFPTVPGVLTHRNVIGRTCSVGLFLNRPVLPREELTFDEAIGAGAGLPVGEDTDLALRLTLRGLHGYYDPSLVIYHPVHRDKSATRDAYIRLKQSHWYVMSKNYRPGFFELRLLRGLAGALVRRGPYGATTNLRAIAAGLKLGFDERRRARQEA